MTPETHIEEKTYSEIKERIFQAIKQSDGLSISDVARLLHLNYITSSKYLAVLEAEKRITHRQIGMAKLFKVVSISSLPEKKQEAMTVSFPKDEGEKEVSG
jgi:predicted transcriptional regulator